VTTKGTPDLRILTLGIGLPDVAIDNYNWASALSFYEYDAIVVEPVQAVSRMIEGIVKGEQYKTYDDIPVADGPTTSETAGLSDLLRRRRDETERLLAKGGLVVVFAHPDVPHPSVSGFTGAHRYYWLPAPAGKDYSSTHLKSAGGRHVNVVDWEHPFANYLDAKRNDVLYRVSIAEGPDGFEDARVLARSDGGTAIAVEIPVLAGRVILIPALPPRITPNDRSAVASNIVTAIRNTLLESAEGTAPEWVDEVSLPGLTDARRRLQDAEAKLDELEAELAEARGEYLGIERFRRILWQEGKYGFEFPVRDALLQLGFRQLSSPDQPGHFTFNGAPVFLEAESSSAAVGMDPHYRLRQRLEARIADDGRTPPRGLIVINGFRETDPAEREQQYTNSLRVAAESLHYCVVQAADLFDAMRDKIEGRSDGKDFCELMMNTDGVIVAPEPAPVEAAAGAAAAGEEESKE
jgi:hypothetical protein